MFYKHIFIRKITMQKKIDKRTKNNIKKNIFRVFRIIANFLIY